MSGHPGGPNWQRCIAGSGRQILVPVHGEMRHMREQARFGLAEGVPSAIVQRNGDLIRPCADGPEKSARSGSAAGARRRRYPSADGATLNERRKMRSNGLDAGAADRWRGPPGGKARCGHSAFRVEQDREDFLADATDAARRPTNRRAMIEKVRRRFGLRSALRNLVDRQEADRRGHAGRG
jgi:ribonuclease J